MPHAESTHFGASVSKDEVYAQVLESLESLLEDERNWVCNTANASSLIWHALKAMGGKSAGVNWAGFYTLNPLKPTHLILGPFQGRVACQSIKIGSGVCGTAFSKGLTQLVPDVERFPGHIACDGETKSEIVVPIKDGQGKFVGVLDLDCTVLEGYDEVDQRWLERVADVLGRGSDWS